MLSKLNLFYLLSHKKSRINLLLFLLFAFEVRVNSQIISYKEINPADAVAIKTGAEQTQKYLSILKDKNVAVVANQTSLIGKSHLVDTLLKLGVKIQKVFGPEHGFRGEADAGELVKNGLDSKTGLPAVSLYGKNKMPTPEQLAGIEIVVFDIQDVGCRFYTFISTLTYVMEACAENGIKLIVLDRPNPNGHYIDGPIMEDAYKSFVGLHPVPIVHGCSIGEYALMVKGENWIKDAVKLQLSVIPVEGWNHNQNYNLPVRPSPNLPNMDAIWLYPSLCLFEGTNVSVGRGTDKPFQCVGYPDMPGGKYSFTPRSIAGAKKPPYLDTLCKGFLLSDFSENYLRDLGQIYLFWLMEGYRTSLKKDKFFIPYFEKLAGTDKLRKQIIADVSEDDIRKSWEPGIKQYKTIRKKYLLYKDFE